MLKIAEIKKIDKENMLDLILDFPEQWNKAEKISEKFKVPGEFKKINKIAVSGMGGSGIGGDLLKVSLLNQLKIPVIVNRNYSFGKFVDKETLVFAVSYSGNTEETLSAYNDAYSKKAKIISITSGGQLKELSDKNGVPVVSIPSGMPPRTAMGYLFLPSLVVLNKLGFAYGTEKDITETYSVLKTLKEKYKPEISNNNAKKLAEKIKGKSIIIYGAADTTESIALRWKCQFNENSKVYAISQTIPEMNHNEIVGWSDSFKKCLKEFSVIFLREKEDFDRIKHRIDISKSIISKYNKDILEVYSSGNSLLARLMSLIYLGDFVSFYLAILNKIDPTPVDNITFLKNQLSKK